MVIFEQKVIDRDALASVLRCEIHERVDSSQAGYRIWACGSDGESDASTGREPNQRIAGQLQLVQQGNDDTREALKREGMARRRAVTREVRANDAIVTLKITALISPIR
ncbi:hypothetical protein P3T21_006447 [Paraburkholderia sp. GAS334]